MLPPLIVPTGILFSGVGRGWLIIQQPAAATVGNIPERGNKARFHSEVAYTFIGSPKKGDTKKNRRNQGTKGPVLVRG